MKHLSQSYTLAVILLATALVILWGNGAMAMTLKFTCVQTKWSHSLEVHL
jgi:hypothetical protein